MSENISTTLQPALTSRLLQLIEPLKQTQAGAVLYQHLAALAEQTDADQLAMQQAYGALMRDLITTLANELPKDSNLQAHLRMIQTQLRSPLSLSDLQMLHRVINTISQANTDTTAANTQIGKQESSNKSMLNESSQRHYEDITMQDAAQNLPPVTAPNLPTRSSSNAPLHGAPEQRVDLTYRRHLDDKRERIIKIQKTLSRHVTEVIKQNEEFGVLLEVEYDALRQTDNIKELQLLKQSLLHEVEKLLKGNHSIASKLDKAKNYLKIIESEGHHLNEELTRVHILSLTDELTELPNRRAFMRRLEDEVARVQRYGSPLSMALIDMDSFKSINDTLGHSAGDEVLRTFSKKVLSIFRHHDMVARYGGEEFAILLPNTDIGGTRRALEKVREQAAQTHYLCNGATLPLPTFSAGIALYKPGETPGNLIERADKALYGAKDKGRNRIEIAPTDTDSASSSSA